MIVKDLDLMGIDQRRFPFMCARGSRGVRDDWGGDGRGGGDRVGASGSETGSRESRTSPKMPTANRHPLITSWTGWVCPVSESPSITTAAVPGAMPTTLATRNGASRTDDSAQQ